jgi:hypothetical protein
VTSIDKSQKKTLGSSNACFAAFPRLQKAQGLISPKKHCTVTVHRIAISARPDKQEARRETQSQDWPCSHYECGTLMRAIDALPAFPPSTRQIVHSYSDQERATQEQTAHPHENENEVEDAFPTPHLCHRRPQHFDPAAAAAAACTFAIDTAS